jgi:hypothetical protein
VVVVSGAPIAPVIPNSAGLPAHGSSASSAVRVLPLPRLAVGVRHDTAVYGLATVDYHGRIADRAVTAAVGWSAGTRLSIGEDRGLIILVADECGVFALTRSGHLHLPIGVRRWCALAAGDRVLLVAEPAHDTVVVYPPAALDAMVRPVQDGVFGGLS